MKKIISIILIFLLILSFAVGCEKDTPKNVRLVEVTHSVFYAPQYVAIEKGFFDEEGIKN